MNAKLALGDIVKQKDKDAPVMTIETVLNDGAKVICVWFDRESNSFIRSSFSAEALVKIPRRF